MAKYELVGDQKSLSKTPVSSPSSNPKGGSVQLVGDHLPINRTPIQSPSANPRGGTTQLVGDGVKLSRTPQKGWGSAAKLPMSDRSIEQSHTAASKGKK